MTLYPLLAFTLLQCGHLAAQHVELISPGSRIRLSVVLANEGEQPGVIIGQLVALDADSLVLKTENGPGDLRVAVSSITRIDVSRGYKRAVPTGMRNGFLIGVGIGALIGYTANQFPSYLEDTSDRDAALMGAAGFGLAGVIAGGFVGATKRIEWWEKVPFRVK